MQDTGLIAAGAERHRQREAEWLSIQMTRKTPHHHPAEDRFPKTSLNGGIAVTAVIFLTFMGSITRSGLSDGAVAGWEAEGGVCVYGGCTKPCQTTPHTITNGRMRNPFGLLTLNFMNQTRQHFRFQIFLLLAVYISLLCYSYFCLEWPGTHNQLFQRKSWVNVCRWSSVVKVSVI